mmetsp:Transcript_5397/g.12262  ORF Transcript_5397/g.12262 Transcript_5397/m.12262 type:complete len:89 (-) Transcript_5397:168-434(-)
MAILDDAYPLEDHNTVSEEEGSNTWVDKDLVDDIDDCCPFHDYYTQLNVLPLFRGRTSNHSRQIRKNHQETFVAIRVEIRPWLLKAFV